MLLLFRIIFYYLYHEKVPDHIEFTKAKTIIYSDAKKVVEDNVQLESINQFSIGNKVYSANVQKIRNVYLNDFSYAVLYTLAREWMQTRKVGGWFYVIKTVTIYLKDMKDKKALKKAKQVLQCIQEQSDIIMNSSVSELNFLTIKSDYRETLDQVYTLTR